VYVILYKITFLLTNLFTMKGYIMDKKILLGGAAALILAGGLYATPASANIELSIGGEAQVMASMSDTCFTAASNTTLEAFIESISGASDTADDEAAINTYLATSIFSGMAHNAAAVNTTSTAVAAVEKVYYDHSAEEEASHHDLVIVQNSSALATGDILLQAATAAVADTDFSLSAISFATDPCAGADPDNPVLGFKKEITIEAGGTLANGLSVTFADKIDLTDVAGEQGAFELDLSGAFGSLKIKDGASGGVDAVLLDKFDIDVAGDNLGKFKTETAGTDGTGLLYGVPSMGAMDIYVSYAPNSDDSGYDTAGYTDTFGFGAVYNGDITVAAGIESASANAAANCSGIAASGLAAGTAADTMDAIYGGTSCGDQTLTYVGAEMAVADMTIKAGYNLLDTDEADTTGMGLGLSTAVGGYDLDINYRNTVKEYLVGGFEDTQSIIGVSLGTALGDGVDMKFQFSQNDVDLASQATARGGNDSTSDYFAEASMTVGF
jgi:hypothetical protein